MAVMEKTKFGRMAQLILPMLSGKCEVMQFVNKGSPHMHDVDEVAISVAGSGTVVIASTEEQREVHLEAGEFVVIPAGHSHYMIPDDKVLRWSMLIAYERQAVHFRMLPEEQTAWQKFREAGLLWWINRGLHLFGWAIVVELPDDVPAGEALPISVYPTDRIPYRGFSRESEEECYEKLSAYLAEHAAETHREVKW